MKAARRFPHRWVVAIVSTLLIVTLTTPVWAQYSIPDCLVAAINGLLPDEGFAAARDQNYKKDSATWNAETAGLTPEQLQGYRTYFCANFSVSDQGADADGGHNILVNWPTVDGYLQTIGQRRGQNGGGSSSGTTSGTGSTGTGSTTSSGTGKTGTGTVGSANVPDIPAVAPADLLFDASFDTLPDNLELLDADNKTIDASVTTDAGDTVLQVKADTTRSLFITDAGQWTDYAIEARVKVKDGTLILSTRTADDYCSSYDFYVEPATSYGSLTKSDGDCNSTLLQDRSDLTTVKPNKWTTLRLESTGDQLNALVNETKVLSTSDGSYTEGFPALYLFPDEGKTATLEIDSLRVVALHALPETLADYNKTPAEAIAELQRLGQVPTSKGTLIFLQKSAYAAGSGIHYFAMAPRSPRTDIVIAATLKFNAPSSDEIQTCALMARFGSSGNSGQGILIGFTGEGYLTLGEFSDSPEHQQNLISPAADYPPGTAHHLLVTLIGTQVVAYVDGARVLTGDNFLTDPGTYLLALSGANGNARCDATNFWAYSFK